MIKVYTDGACSGNPGPGGWAFVICKDEEILQCSGAGVGNTTNNRMELMAVIRALEEITKIDNKGVMPFQIISDSAYVINAINLHWIGLWSLNGWKTSKGDKVKNSDLWIRFLVLRNKCEKQNKALTFEKIKGHSGNYFNEWVDSMARNEVINQLEVLKNEAEVY